MNNKRKVLEEKEEEKKEQIDSNDSNKRVRVIIQEIKELKNQFDYSKLDIALIHNHIFDTLKWKVLMSNTVDDYTSDNDQEKQDTIDEILQPVLRIGIPLYCDQFYFHHFLREEDQLQYNEYHEQTKHIFQEMIERRSITSKSLYATLRRIVKSQLNRLNFYYRLLDFNTKLKLTNFNVTIYTGKYFKDKPNPLSYVNLLHLTDYYWNIHERVTSNNRAIMLDITFTNRYESAYFLTIDELYHRLLQLKEAIRINKVNFPNYLIKLILKHLLIVEEIDYLEIK